MPSGACGEERLLAQALLQRQPLILFFKAERCNLCRSLQDKVDLEAGRGVCVRSITTDDHVAWAPEMLKYNIETVPCFVALDKSGRAIAKTGKPRGVDHMQQSFNTLVRLLKQ